MGLFSRSETLNCNSPATCANQTQYRARISSNKDEDLTWDFAEESWLDKPIRLSSVDGRCAVMNNADDSPADNHKITSLKCTGLRNFACMIDCSSEYMAESGFRLTDKTCPSAVLAVKCDLSDAPPARDGNHVGRAHSENDTVYGLPDNYDVSDNLT